MDSDTLFAVGAGVLGLAAGIAIPVWYEVQTVRSEERGNDEPCFQCQGTGSVNCRLCDATGKVVVVLGSGDKEESTCVNCEGKGTITCNNCNGSGIQPRYLDRREFQDDD